MTAAYSRLKVLDQRTEFSAERIPFDLPDSPFGIPKKPTEKPDGKARADAGPTGAARPNDSGKEETTGRRLRLRYAFPNFLRLEMQEAGAGSAKPTRYLWDSDGKLFWTLIPDKNWYTREKAPAHLADFRKLERLDANSLEMLMLLGLNPFANIREQCDRLTWEGAATAKDGEVDVVALRSDNRTADTVAKLYIGHTDLLLRRVVIETTPAVGPTTPGKIGDAMDDLAPDDPNAAPVQPPDDPAEAPAILDAPPPPAPTAGARPMKTRVTYENTLTPNPTFDYMTFQFVIPENAFRFGVDEPTKAKKRKPLNLMRHRKKYRIINP